MMKRFLAFALWVLFVAEPVSQTLSSPPDPARDRRFAQEAYVIEQAREAWRFENDGTGRCERYVRVKVQSDAGVQVWGQLTLPYNAENQRLEVQFVMVRKPDGTIVTAPGTSVQDLSSTVQREAPVYTDTREKHVTVPSLRPGDVLEFAHATIIHTPLARGHFWTEHDFIAAGIVLDEQFEIDLPSAREVTLKVRPGIEQTTTERDGRRIHRWHSARLTNESEDDSKAVKKPSKKKESAQAAIRLTSFANWEQIGEWYRTLEQAQRKPTAEVRQKADELTVGRATDREKLAALYEYVASNIRYVSLSFGIGRYQPHAAADVLRNQYGDCKDKHTLLASLAASIGLDVSAALINSREKIDPDFPSPSQFDHVITRAGDVWLDATTEVAPFGLIAPSLRKKQALVVAADGRARLEESPLTSPVDTTAIVDIQGTLSDAGTLDARVRMSSTGDLELLMRTIFRRTPNAQWKTILTGMASYADLDGDIDDWNVSDPSAMGQPFTVDFHVSKPNFVAWTKKDFSIALPMGDAVSMRSVDDEDEADKMIPLGPPRRSVYTLRLELPRTYTARAPVPLSVARDYGDYSSKYALDGNVFTAERSLTVRQPELPAARRGDLASFRRTVSDDVKQTVAVANTTGAAVSAIQQMSVKELTSSAWDAEEDGRYEQAVTLLKRALELEPDHQTAWATLGRAYMGLRQTDAAIDAFKRQVDINAYDQRVYKNLGWAYRTQQKLGEAESAFQKQLELNPLDQWTQRNLGELYLESHRYEAAVPPLEKAAALAPREAAPQIRLGEAFLHLAQPTRARAAFDRAIELDPSPRTWNEVAYQLALNRVDLDLAQRYAESAVAAIAASSRNFAIDRVTPEDFGTLVTLAAYWDTLGWVHFAKGNLPQAEAFVHAAWVLIDNAEVGDHLGQIYEKAGRRDDAVRLYATSLNGDRPDPQTRERLIALAGSAAAVDAAVAKHRDNLMRDRSVEVDGKGPAGTKADFIVLSATDGAVQEVRFVGGDETLRPMGDTLRGRKHAALFPDKTPAKILQRGTVTCPAGDRLVRCRFVVLPASDAQRAQSAQ